MEDKFLLGVLLGMLGGALLVTNCAKARQAVVEGQAQVLSKAKKMQAKTESEQE